MYPSLKNEAFCSLLRTKEISYTITCSPFSQIVECLLVARMVGS